MTKFDRDTCWRPSVSGNNGVSTPWLVRSTCAAPAVAVERDAGCGVRERQVAWHLQQV